MQRRDLERHLKRLLIKDDLDLNFDSICTIDQMEEQIRKVRGERDVYKNCILKPY